MQRQILVTGGTGSFGRAFVRRILATGDDVTLRVYSRDELKQYEMARAFGGDPRLRFCIGDVRDRERLVRAMYGVEWVVHAAALKQVDLCEYNPAEAVKTNIQGSQNVIEAAIDAKVKRVVALSTDKAVSPVNLYGATKLCAEKLFVHGNHYAGPRDTRFACVRYGNVLGSRGSVVPLFLAKAPTGVLPLTDLRMTRFWITLDHAVDLVQRVLADMRTGEVFVPKIPSMRLVDLAKAIAPEAHVKEVGMRPGEKLHEMLLSPEEAHRTREYGGHYVISRHAARSDGRPVREDFCYRSDTNTQWLDVGRLRELVAELGRDAA